MNRYENIKYLFILFNICLPTILCGQDLNSYPSISKGSISNTYFGDTIQDPYQWMENDQDPRLQAWLKEQEKLTNKLVRQQTRQYELKNQIISMISKSKTNVNDNYVEDDIDKDIKKSKYEFRFEIKSFNSAPDLLFRIRDVNEYSTLVKTKDFKRNEDDIPHINKVVLNNDHDLAFIELNFSGSDWRELHFYDLKTGNKLPDVLRNLRTGSSPSWHNKGLFYAIYDEPRKGRELLDVPTGQSLMFHKMGTKQVEDINIYQGVEKDGLRSFSFGKIDSTTLFVNHHTKNGDQIFKALSTINLSSSPDSLKMNSFLVYPNQESLYFKISLIRNDTAYMITNWNAPNRKVMIADITKQNKLFELVPEFDITLRKVSFLGKDRLVCTYRREGSFISLIYNKKGELIHSINFPPGKKVVNLYENDEDARHTVFGLSSFYHPTIWYQMSFYDYSFKPVVSLQVPYDVSNFETRYVKYKSKDGTEIPMYITCRKDIELEGKNPVLLYGYGGYGHTVEPSYNKLTMLWLFHGGILAIPNVRGGGAEGDEWSKAGRNLNKQNAIDDFSYAAKYLIDENYTNSDHLLAKGASHGGLLVAASAMQHPELYKAVIAEAGPYDMLRSSLFTSGGHGLNINEYGNINEEKGYKSLKKYSPLHTIEKGKLYPDLLIITGDSDDRVPPLHSYKFVATLQEKADPRSNIQLYVVPGAGHGGALTTEAYIQKLIFTNYFLFDQTNIKFW